MQNAGKLSAFAFLIDCVYENSQSFRKAKPGWVNSSCGAEQRMAGSVFSLMSAAFDRVSRVARLLSR